MRRIVWVLVLICAVTGNFGRVLQPLEFSQELRKLGVSEWDIPLLVCHAHQVSGLKTDFHLTQFDPGDNIYGILGLKVGLPPRQGTLVWNYCGLTVDKLTDDDVSDDIGCMLNVTSQSRYRDIFGKSFLMVALLHWDDASFIYHCVDWWDTLPPLYTTPEY